MKLVVWDFHGVLETGTEAAVIEISNAVLERFGYSERFTEQDVIRLYGKRWFQYFEDLLSGESHERHVELQEACFKMSSGNPDIILKHIKPNDHIHEVFDAVKNGNHDQILISNMDSDSMPLFLQAVNATNFFNEGNAFAVGSHHESVKLTKADYLREFLNGKEYDGIIIIGDSPGDVALKDVAGGVSYLYAHPGTHFRECEADYKINDLREVLKEL